MKKIKLFFLLLSIVLFTQSYAQETFKPKEAKFKEPLFQKGSKLIGLSGGLGFSNGAFGYNVNSRLGYFLKDGLMIGAELGQRYNSLESKSNLNIFSASILGRYYFLKDKKVSLFIQGGISHEYFNNNIESLEPNFKNKGLVGSYNLGGGINFKINKRLSLEFSLNKNLYPYDNYPANGFLNKGIMPRISLNFRF